MDVMDIYESISTDSTDEEKTKACQAIIEASDDIALVISLAKQDGW